VSIRGMREGGRTYDACFEFGWFAVEYVGGFDTVFDDSDGRRSPSNGFTHHQRLSTVLFSKPRTHLVVSPASLVNISPSFCRTAMRNW